MRSRSLFYLVSLMFVVMALGLAVSGKWTSHAAVTPFNDASETGTPATTTDNLSFAGDEHGFNVSNMDKSVGACENFYQFANGGWVSRNPVPPVYSSWGRFNELAERNRDQLHQILEDAAHNKKARKGTNEQKIGDYYASCMDEARIESAGTKPIQPELNRINKIKDLQDLRDTVAHLQSIGVPVLFRFSSGQDYKQSTQVIGQLTQGGLSLPDRDYYLNTDEKSKDIRDKYVTHVSKMFQLLGDDGDTAAAESKTVMGIETKLAEASATRVQRRNPEANYHKMKQGELKSLTSNFAWDDYFKTIGLRGGSFDVNVGQPDFFKTLDQQLTAVSIADWKTYLRWHLLDARARALPKKFVQEDFDFNQGVLQGTKEMLPRWKRCVGATDGALGEAVGQVYVQKTFPPEAKARAVTMVQNLIAALRDDLGTLNWMSQTTRQRATAKLEAFTRKIGYPDQWRDYSALKVDRKSFMDDLSHAVNFEHNRQLNKIGKPVVRTEWGMTPPTVNAYYSPTMNEIVFPAGILQWPFYDQQADDALNYGGIGAVIGHEMTHGFDDSGAKFDPQGNLQNWWTEADLKNFQGRAQCVIDQFDSFLVQPGLHHNGKLVVGESIADLGGLTVAYAAFQKSMEGKPRPPDIDGFTPEQRFFLGYAQIWAQNVRPEYERQLVLTDPHPLGRFRVNGPLSNMPAFAQAFQCKTGEAMVRSDKERCQIW